MKTKFLYIVENPDESGTRRIRFPAYPEIFTSVSEGEDASEVAKDALEEAVETFGIRDANIHSVGLVDK